MKPSALLLASMFLLGVILASACKEGGDPGQKKFEGEDLGGIYQGTASIEYKTHYRYPDGREEEILDTVTFSDFAHLKRVESYTYEIEEWKSGCDLRVCCLIPMCPGQQIMVSEEHTHGQLWDYDFVNRLSIRFNPDEDSIDVRYFFSDGYYTEVQDDTSAVLYWYQDTETYTFKAVR